MRTFRLALVEFRRFRTPSQRLALAFIVLIPLLYGGLYLWSTWDPYGRLDQIPVAVVNNDQPVVVSGQRIAAGEQFVAELRKTPIFGWRFVDDAEASAGVRDSRYYFKISVPRDFSARLSSGATGIPRRAGMLITLDDANGYGVGIMAKSVQSELESKINSAAVGAYYESAFGNLQRPRAGIGDAAAGAEGLRDNLATAHQGGTTLVTGLTQLRAGADQLAPGAQRVSVGVNTIAGIVAPLANGIADTIPSITQNVTSAANAAAGLAGSAATAAGTVAGNPDSVQNRVVQLAKAHPELAGDPAFQQLVAATNRAAGQTAQASTAAGQVRTTTAAMAMVAGQLTADAARLQTQARNAATEATQLTAGAGQVAVGAATLDEGMGTALTGATDLNAGLGRLSDSAGQLANGLADVHRQLPVLSSDQRRNNAATLASPVDVVTTNLHPAYTYGRGLTPFVFAVALWVFGIAAFLLLRPVSARALAGRTGDLGVAMAGWLPAGLACIAGGLLLLIVADWGLRLDPVHPWELAGLIVVAAAAFTAIAQFLETMFGAVATAITLVLLLLQLATCAGIYPYETLPVVLRALHPFLPMTYLVDGLRVTITGGNPAHLVRDCLILAGFLATALGFAALAVHQRREWRIATLKPELAI